MKILDFVISKFPWLKKFTPIIIFFTKVLLIYIAFLFTKFIHRTLISSEINSAISAYLINLDIYTIGAKTIIYPAQWLLSVLGYDTIISERTIYIPGFRGIIIHAPCLGYNVFSFFIALIIAYPVQATLKKKTLFILIGLIMIHVLNIFRVSALLILNRYSIPINYHHELFNLIIYGFVFGLFYWWINQYSSKRIA